MHVAASTLRFSFVLALVAAAAACSFTRVGYNQAETLAAWRVSDYFELAGSQRDDFHRRFQALHLWHRHDQLPEYAQFLRAAQHRLQLGLTPHDVEWFVDGIRGRYRTLARHSAPEAAAWLATLTPAQVEGLQQRFDRENRKWAREHKLNGSVRERNEATARRTIAQLKSWLAPLNYEQEQRVIAIVQEWPDTTALYYAERLRRQREFIELLAHRGEERERFAARLTDWLVNWERGRLAEYQRANEALWARRTDLFVTVDRMLTPAQRSAAVRRLQTYAADFLELAGRSEPGRTAGRVPLTP
jgi:hypothetical protein